MLMVRVELASLLKEEGLQTIVNIKASLNLGLSELLKEAASPPNTIAVARIIKGTSAIPHPEWMAGFVSGDGCFTVKITKGRNRVGLGAQIVFQIAQHIRDKELMKSFIAYFKCSHYIQSSTTGLGYYKCTKFSDNYNIILPFFSQHPVQGIKAKDFLDWVKVAELIKKEII